MEIYEKPMAELVKFESERILTDDGEIGEMPPFSADVEEW